MTFRQNKKNVHIFILFKSLHPQLLMHGFSFWRDTNEGHTHNYQQKKKKKNKWK